ncbi:hypothetical protein DV737_g1727, partial [Chaetothyriales sp. CBS 132003]
MATQTTTITQAGPSSQSSIQQPAETYELSFKTPGRSLKEISRGLGTSPGVSGRNSLEAGDDDLRNDMSPPASATEVLQRWNQPRGNIARLAFAFFSFVIAGMNDAATGALIPSLESYYSLNYTIVSLIFLSPFVGYSTAAFANARIHLKFGQRGIAIGAPICHIITYAVIAAHPPFPVVIAINAIAGFGNGLTDACFNAWVGVMANANAVQGIMHSSYSIGALLAPLIATTMVSKANLPWWTFYLVMAGASVVEFVGLTITFWPMTANVYRTEHPRDPQAKGGRTREALRNRVTWLCSLFFFTYLGVEVGLGGWIITFMLRVRDASPYKAGVSGSGFWIGQACGRACLGFVTERFGERVCISIYLAACIALQLVFWLVPQFVVSAVAVAFLGFFLGPLFPACVMMATKLLPKHIHVSAIGFAMAIGGTGGTVFPFIIGAIAAAKGSNVFTSKLPVDAKYPTPESSHNALRKDLGPRIVHKALYTYVRPEVTEDPELLAVSTTALRDLGLSEEAAQTDEFKAVVAGNKFYWDAEPGNEGVYPWAQCYGGFQFGSWAGQLGDGRAISLFEATNPATQKRYEVQLKGAGRTPYSRFADGKAVLRSSIREFVVSEYLNALGVATTRALSLTLCPKSQVVRERLEPGAIVCRFAETWIRFGTFDLMRARGDRDLTRLTATYVAEEVFGGWDKLPGLLAAAEDGDGGEDDAKDAYLDPPRGVPKEALQGKEGEEQNRFARLYREIARRSARMVAWWQAYGFMNGVLNTDNTSIYGLSIDYGPFAFMDHFDPTYTPNHDDSLGRYSYQSQPTIIWWNLVRLGEALGELIGSGERVDQELFVEKGVEEDFAPVLIKRGETIIHQTGNEYKQVFLGEYRRLMTARLGLKTYKDSDFNHLFSSLLDTMEALELDFNHFFRRLSYVKLGDVDTEAKRKATAKRFFHSQGITALNETEQSASDKVGEWLARWRERIIEDWGEAESADKQREESMAAVNPNFVPRGWLLDEVIERVEKKSNRDILPGLMKMALEPFKDSWGWHAETERRFCGDVPKYKRAMHDAHQHLSHLSNLVQVDVEVDPATQPISVQMFAAYCGISLSAAERQACGHSISADVDEQH